jgi:inorganic pyrophosphatase/exopolyphosphatase
MQRRRRDRDEFPRAPSAIERLGIEEIVDHHADVIEA